MCKKCLKKGTNHTVDNCRAPNCRICKGPHNALIFTEEGGQKSMFNTDEETKGEGDKESKGDDGNTDSDGNSDIERMNQKREVDHDQEYEEPGEDESQIRYR